MVNITLQDAREALQAVVAEAGEDYVYEQRGGQCNYVYEGAPDCGVARALARLGVPLYLLEELEGKRPHAWSFTSRLEEHGYDMSAKAAGYLTTFQVRQDQGWTWGHSLGATEELT